MIKHYFIFICTNYKIILTTMVIFIIITNYQQFLNHFIKSQVVILYFILLLAIFNFKDLQQNSILMKYLNFYHFLSIQVILQELISVSPKTKLTIILEPLPKLQLYLKLKFLLQLSLFTDINKTLCFIVSLEHELYSSQKAFLFKDNLKEYWI